MNESFRTAALPAGATQPEAFGLPETPMSAARLAAEAAFAGPRTPLADPIPALVTVRRARLALPPRTPASGAVTAAVPAAKVQRVFRIDAPRGQPPEVPQPGPAAAEDSAAPMPAATEASAAAAAPAGAVLRRRRRVDPDKRPGPVLHVVVEQQPPSAAPAASVAPLQSERLLLDLAALDPVLQDIARAQAWRFDGCAFAPEWQRLACALEALRAELHAHARRHRPGFEDYQAQL